MTEAEWLVCRILMSMWHWAKAGDRKARLFACACCRRVWRLLVLEASQQAVEAAESYADGLSDEGALTRALELAGRMRYELHAARPAAIQDFAARGELHDEFEDYQAARALIAQDGALANAEDCAATAAYECTESSWHAIHTAEEAVHSAGWERSLSSGLDYPARNAEAEAVEASRQCDLLRDLLRYPGRPVSSSPAWLTPTVTTLATAAYEERALPSGELDPARLAVLADALEDAGCQDADILGHLRGPGPHVRGCWPVDLILGKE